MKLNRRDFLRLSATVATGAVLASCQPAAPAPAVEEKPAAKVEEVKKEEKPAEKIKLRYMDWGGERYPKSWQEVGPQFLEDHPEIEISYEPRPDLWREVITAEYVAGTGPDLFGHCCDHAKVFWEAGQIKDIKPYVDRDISAEELKDFFESQLTFWTDKGTGALMAWPKYQGNLCIIYNEEMVKEAGVTVPEKWTDAWGPEEYREFLQKLTVGEYGSPDRVFGGGRSVWSDRNTPCFNSNGAHFVNPEDDTDCWLGKPEAMEVQEFWRVLRMDDHTMPMPADMAGEKSMRNLFPIRRLASEEEGVWAFNDTMDRSEFKWNICPLWSFKVDWPMTLSTTDGWSMWSGTKHPDAVWELIKFLASPTFEASIAKTTFLQPARKSMVPKWIEILREADERFNDINLEVILESAEGGYGVPMELYYSQSLGEEIMKPVYEQVFELGTAGVDAIAKACDELTEKLRAEKAKA